MYVSSMGQLQPALADIGFEYDAPGLLFIGLGKSFVYSTLQTTSKNMKQRVTVALRPVKLQILLTVKE